MNRYLGHLGGKAQKDFVPGVVCDWCDNEAVKLSAGELLCEECDKKDLLTRMIEDVD